MFPRAVDAKIANPGERECAEVRGADRARSSARRQADDPPGREVTLAEDSPVGSFTLVKGGSRVEEIIGGHVRGVESHLDQGNSGSGREPRSRRSLAYTEGIL